MGVLKPNKPAESGGFKIIDSIEPMQGPSYILAKRLRHWRSVVAREEGHVVSSNVSPTTATASVMLKPSIVAAIGGMHIFKPVEVMYQELSMTMMGALLINDIKNPASAAQPSTKLGHPLCLLQKTSFNGGFWRCPYSMTTITVPSAVFYFLSNYWPLVIVSIAVILSVVGYVVAGDVPGVLSAMLPSSTADWLATLPMAASTEL